jgi:hypothetical protein
LDFSDKFGENSYSMIKIRSLTLAVFVLATVSQVELIAQPEEALLKELAIANQQTIEALVLYPEKTRMAILEATKYPSLLIQLEEMKERTSQAFQTLIEDFPKEDQILFYELNRYPGLLDQLIRKEQVPGEHRKALEILPSNAQSRAFELVQSNPSTIEKIYQLTRTAQIAYSKQLMDYPIRTQEAFSQLIQQPEVVELLNQDLRFTILVGDTYRKDSLGILRSMDSLHAVVARAHAEELNDWKATLENNPEAATELQQASELYAQEMYPQAGLPLADTWYGNDPYWTGQVPLSPYFYWFGYPWWEPYPRWYPYPWWWNWGGYFYGSRWVIIYLPSYHFMHWYFEHPHHHHHYSHLSEQFVRHYHHHRRSGTTISMEVKNWQVRHRSVLSETFLKADNGLRERLITYADFEQKRTDYNLRNPTKPRDEALFLEKNSRKYPSLKKANQESKQEIQIEKTREINQRKDWAPPKEPSYPLPVKREVPTRNPVQVPPPTKTPPNKPNEARDYHFQKWEERKPTAPVIKQAPPTKNTVPKKRGG